MVQKYIYSVKTARKKYIYSIFAMLQKYMYSVDRVLNERAVFLFLKIWP